MATADTWSGSGTSGLAGGTKTNNGMTVMHGGNVGSIGGSTVNNFTLGQERRASNKPVDGADAQAVIAGFDFSSQVAGKYVIQHGGSAQQFLGASGNAAQANTLLQGAAGFDKRAKSVNGCPSGVNKAPWTTTAIRAGNWNPVTATFSSIDVTQSGAWDISANAEGPITDINVADKHPGSANAGKLTLNYGHKGGPRSKIYHQKQDSSETGNTD